MKNYKPLAGLILILIFGLCSSTFYCQVKHIENFQFISPIPGSSLHLPATSIIIRQGDNIDGSTINNYKILVEGSISGIHKGDLILSTDKKTLHFQPFKAFTRGEEVRVILENGILTDSGIELAPIEFTFKISENIYTDYDNRFFNAISEANKTESSFGNNLHLNNPESINPEYPPDFPNFAITISNNPSPEYIFISPHDLSFTTAYLMIIDNDGIPIYYVRDTSPKFDFKKQFNGLLTFWDHNSQKFFEMDSAYKIIDSYQCGNGYHTDAHELLVFPNGHSYLMSYDPQIVRMDTIVQGGDTAAIVYGLVVQELDAQKNVIFQWRSWDHFQITDATYDIDLTQHSIDYVHGNSIEVDHDGNLLISCRNMDEITKIDGQTGDIIWRLGGAQAENNQFQFINDPITFSHQHDIRRLPNGNITLFDNGNLHTPPFSRSLEYQLDEVNKIAVLVWKYNNNPISFEVTRGSSRRLENHNTLIGWGDHLTPKSISEIKADGTRALELDFPDSLVNYRTFKFNWRTNLFVVDPDSIFFESVPVGDSSTIDVLVRNNSSEELNITGFYNKNDIYSVNNTLPINVPPFGSEEISISFSPEDEGYFKDKLYIFSDTDTSRIAQVLVMGGRTDTIFSNVNHKNVLGKFSLEQNFPNPFNPTTNIRFQIAELGFVSLKVYDVLGNEIATLVNEEKPAGAYVVKFNRHSGKVRNLPAGRQGLPSGIYFYRLQAGDFVQTKKMLLLK